MTEPRDEDSRTGSPQRGVLDPIMSNRDGLFSALEERGASPVESDEAWAHRRGEPRLLVLCWAIYLLAASGATIMRMPEIGFAEARFVQGAARVLMVLIAGGLTLLWPMVRLSQATPRRPSTAAIVDFVALAAPLCAVLWPVTWLGRWDWPVTAGVMGMLGGWGLCMAAIVAMGTRGSSSAARTGWAILVVVALGAGPVVGAMLSGVVGGATWAFYASPMTGIFALTTMGDSLVVEMSTREWWAALGPLIAACALWALVAMTGSPSRD